MCDNEKHLPLSEPEHFARHTIMAEAALSRVKRCSLDENTAAECETDKAMVYDAQEALRLAPSNITPECLAMLAGAAGLGPYEPASA